MFCNLAAVPGVTHAYEGHFSFSRLCLNLLDGTRCRQRIVFSTPPVWTGTRTHTGEYQRDHRCGNMGSPRDFNRGHQAREDDGGSQLSPHPDGIVGRKYFGQNCPVQAGRAEETLVAAFARKPARGLSCEGSRQGQDGSHRIRKWPGSRQRIRRPVEVDNVNGSIHIANTTGGVAAETTNGSVSLSFDQLPDSGLISARTVNGRCSLKLPRDGSFQLNARVVNGRVSSDFPTSQGRWSRKHIRVGDGGPEIEVETVNGNVSVRSQ